MHTVDDITRIFRKDINLQIPKSITGNKYLGLYNKLLSGLFDEYHFYVTFPGKQNVMEVVFVSGHSIVFDPKSVLLLLALDEEPNPDETVAVEGEMQKLFMKANPPDEIQTIYGLCVWETRFVLYSYHREQGVVTPIKGHSHFDLDLKEEDGAAAVVEVAEEVKRMCRVLLEEAKAKAKATRSSS